jgi:hypothetical protein
MEEMNVKTTYSFAILLTITIVNYLALIPYYLYNYYFPYHVLPSLRACILVGLTLVWFLGGYLGFRNKSRLGYFLLLTFLIIEALFYLMTILSGAVISQLRNPSLLMRAIFFIGYLSGLVAAYYVCVLVRFRAHYLKEASK